MRENIRVLAVVVAWNSADEIAVCLESLTAQDEDSFRVVVLDNASTDATVEIVQPFLGPRVELLRSDKNLGFSGGNNRCLDHMKSDYVLFLNPDARVEPDFVRRAADILDAHPRCGSLSPRILRMAAVDEDFRPLDVLDSAGIFWTRTQRHLDRGSGEPAAGKFPAPETVFGASGACAFYRRACLDDIAFRGEVWDEDFFAYREDADLAWRAAWRGWSCRYEPALTAWHVRRVVPQNRRTVAAAVNMHSVKNRFLLRIKNMPLATWLRFLPWIAARDLVVLGGVVLGEWRSLAAFPGVVRLLPRFLAKRRHVLGRASASRREMERWFTEAARPAPKL